MNGDATVWCNGSFMRANEVKISPFDLGITVGLGVFETLVAYNGSNGMSYHTTDLSGDLPDQDDGFGTLAFAMSLQNGSPDGIALVDAGGTVVQFLSYEGSFEATDGPANGMTSTDIGVSEPGSTNVGYSLQLGNITKGYTDFVWQDAPP
ncbi:MAG: hypothetical protein DSY38_05225 [Fusobacteria bacterium]|nr:MAG: hypothetical protein DSY38_05225 [Fusobacteriota bacterium]